MKILIVEDDPTSRNVLQRLIASYGEADVAENGKEAVVAFTKAIDAGDPYELICLDIMLPEMDGQEVLREIRRIEEEKGIAGIEGVRVIMTTALNDAKSIMTAYNSQCEGYLVKPIVKEKLNDVLKKLRLVE